MVNITSYWKRVSKQYFCAREVPIESVHHSDLPCYVNEGFGGKPIINWPVTRFFQLYVHGQVEQAAQEFLSWYQYQFSKYGDVPKEKGGMYNGSLYRLVLELHGRGGSSLEFESGDFDSQLVEAAIQERVQQRFELLDSLQSHGFQPGNDPVWGISKLGRIYLRGGHHRVAALHALGFKVVPQAVVYPGVVYAPRDRIAKWKSRVLG